jgi:uncharacterized UBP type Zn finger protein
MTILDRSPGHHGRGFVRYTGLMTTCSHLAQIDEHVKPKTPKGCQECLTLNQSWVNLRLCLTCGHVGCCDNSFGKHASAHFKSTSHPIIESYKDQTQFRWCYVDDMVL